MKICYYGVKMIGTLYDIATTASGLKGAAAAAEAAVLAARSAAAAAATEIFKRQSLEQVKPSRSDAFATLSVSWPNH